MSQHNENEQEHEQDMMRMNSNIDEYFLNVLITSIEYFVNAWLNVQEFMQEVDRDASHLDVSKLAFVEVSKLAFVEYAHFRLVHN